MVLQKNSLKFPQLMVLWPFKNLFKKSVFLAAQNILLNSMIIGRLVLEKMLNKNKDYLSVGLLNFFLNPKIFHPLLVLKKNLKKKS